MESDLVVVIHCVSINYDGNYGSYHGIEIQLIKVIGISIVVMD